MERSAHLCRISEFAKLSTCSIVEEERTGFLVIEMWKTGRDACVFGFLDLEVSYDVVGAPCHAVGQASQTSACSCVESKRVKVANASFSLALNLLLVTNSDPFAFGGKRDDW